jgi:hypothetical protein
MRTALRLTVALVVVGLAIVLLVGCGADQETAGPAEDETTSAPSDETSEPAPSETLPNGPIDFTEVALVSQSNVEGTVSPHAVVLDSEAAVGELASRFAVTPMEQALSRAYARADVPDGDVLIGAVVAISCEAPDKLRVEKTNQGVEVTAVAKISKVQCLVPVTTVALVSVPEAAV